jgi:hypothetical protein
METDTECTVRLCKRHAPTPEAPRRKYSKTGPAESGGTLYCGQCDGELPEVSREEWRVETAEYALELALELALEQRDRALWGF